MALYNGHLDVARFLADAGADVNSRGNNSSTPLHSTAGKGYLDIVKLLLRRSADFNIRDRTSLDLVSDSGKPGVADLSAHMAGPTSLFGAAGATLSTIRPLLRRLAPVQSQCPLYTASQNGQLDIVRSLLERGTDVNERSIFRATALHAASSYGKVEVVKLLVQWDADVDSRDTSGRTPLIWASESGQFEVTQLLIDHGADVNVDTGGLTTALHLALSSGNLKLIQLLLDRGAKVDVPDADGQTPQQLATRLGSYRKIVEMFSGFEEHNKGVTVRPPPPINSKGSPTPHSAPVPTLAGAPVSASPAPAPASATRFAADPTVTAPFVSSHGKTVWQPREDTSRDLYREKSVGDRLQPIITTATAERKKAAQTAQWTDWALNVAISGQVVIGAMALGAAFRGKNLSVAISILSGASTFVTFYSACTRGSDERQASFLRVEALNRFLHEVEAFQLIHGKEVSREWDEKIDGFRLSLENMLGNQPGIMINSEAAGISSSVEKGVGATDPISA
ncbi:ankyrin repeat-containing domain protein [Lactarius deliciosus]|nr:ankyrin repeat-containing domain protein [Lactarius deliciosus]